MFDRPVGPNPRWGQIRAKTFFECDAIDSDSIRYLRVRLVKPVSLGFGKVLRTREFVDKSGLDRSFNLIAACNDESGAGTYFNSSRETFEDRFGNEQIGTNWSNKVSLNAHCK